jgi:hypothetical protein
MCVTQIPRATRIVVDDHFLLSSYMFLRISWIALLTSLGRMGAIGCSRDFCPDRDVNALPATPILRPPAIQDADVASQRVVEAVREAGYLAKMNTPDPQVGMIVNRQGKVIETWIVTSSGESRGDSAAVRAVKRWAFRPGRGLDGSPVCSALILPVHLSKANPAR